MTTGEYVLSQIDGEEDGDYSYSVSGSTITVTSKTTGEALASGTIRDDGGIAWSDTVASGGNENNNNNNNTNNNTNTSTNTNTQENNTNTSEEETQVETVLGIAKDILPDSTSSESPYVLYKAGKNTDDEITYNGPSKNILCRVLYNDETRGLQLVSVNPVRNVTLGENDPIYKNNNDSNLTIAQNSYNGAIINLNNYAEEYLNNDGIAIDARCICSLPTISSTTKLFDKKDNPDDLVSNPPTQEELNLYFMNYDGTHFKGDSNYSVDYNRLKAINAFYTKKKVDGTSGGSNYWFCSRKIRTMQYTDYTTTNFDIRGKNGTQDGCYDLWSDNDHVGHNPTSDSQTFGFRPVFLIDSSVKLVGKGETAGTENNPYTLIIE